MAKPGTSKSKGTSYQTKHTFFFVPKALGDKNGKIKDDTNVPGAMLRLGGYSSVEKDAETAETLDQFYPREYGEKLVDDDTGQILLTGSGQMLVRAGGKMFVNSSAEMDIDSVGNLRVNSDGATEITSQKKVDVNSRNETVSITSAPGKDIIITAGTKGNYGNIEKKANSKKETYFGQDLTVVTEDSKSYFKANKYSYTEGNTYSIFLGTTCTFTAAANLTIGANVDFYIGGSTTYIKINSMSLTAISIGITGFNTSITAMDTGKTFIDVKDKDIRGDKSQIKFVSDGVWSATKTVASAMGSASINMYGMNGFI